MESFYKIIRDTDIDIPENEILNFVSSREILDTLSNFIDIMKYYSIHNHKERKNSKTYNHNVEFIKNLILRIDIQIVDFVPYILIYTSRNNITEKYFDSIKNYLLGQISDGAGGSGHIISNKNGNFYFFLSYR